MSLANTSLLPKIFQKIKQYKQAKQEHGYSQHEILSALAGFL